ncbi:hypothetical protein ES703_29021 [subsurface metagenome]
MVSRRMLTLPCENHTPLAFVPSLFISMMGFCVMCTASQPGERKRSSLRTVLQKRLTPLIPS